MIDHQLYLIEVPTYLIILIGNDQAAQTTKNINNY